MGSLELSAIQTGYLAVAASGFLPRDKSSIIDKLKARETKMKANAADGPAKTFGNSDLAPPTMNLMPFEVRYSEEFSVDLDRSSGASLGIVLGENNGRTLVVERVNPGLVHDWG